MPLIPLAEWRPDTAELNGAYTGDVLNVLCADGSYIPFPSEKILTTALPNAPLGAFVARSLSGQVTVFAGTADKLYVLDNTDLGWDDVSQTGVTYAATSTARWSFTQFGEYVIAVNANDDPQYFQLGVSTEFTDVPGNPPRANYVRTWGDFVVLLNLSSNPNRVHWSAINDLTNWTPGILNSDYQDFEGGVVQGSTQATNPIIFLERAIYVGTFIPGSVQVFSFTKVHDGRGAKSPYSIATRGAFAFYADEGGFFQIGPGGEIANIGFEKVDRTVFGQLASPDIAKIYGAVDPFYSRVYWAVDYGGTGSYNRLLVYDWNLQRWSQAETDLKMHLPAATTGYTLEGLDNVSASLDALPFSLDSKVWQGGAPVLAGFNLDNELIFFSGESKAATLTTQESGDTAGAVTLVKSATPVADTNNSTISFGSRFKRGDNVLWSAPVPQSPATGRCDKIVSARFHKFRMEIPAEDEWTHAQAIDVETQRAGRR